jgi:hypothetical protein
MSDDRLETLRARQKAYRAAQKALERAHEAKASGFELVRLGKVLEKAMQEFYDPLASIIGEFPRKLPPLPLDEALLPKKKPTDE